MCDCGWENWLTWRFYPTSIQKPYHRPYRKVSFIHSPLHSRAVDLTSLSLTLRGIHPNISVAFLGNRILNEIRKQKTAREFETSRRGSGGLSLFFLLLRRRRFNPEPVLLRFVVDEVALGPVLLPLPSAPPPRQYHSISAPSSSIQHRRHVASVSTTV
jgi:hypothetical protein